MNTKIDFFSFLVVVARVILVAGTTAHMGIN